MANDNFRTPRRPYSLLLGCILVPFLCGTGSATALAQAQTEAQCDGSATLPANTKLRVTQSMGRAQVEVTKPGNTGRKVAVEYGDEYYVQAIGPDGRARVAFALTEPSNSFVITMSEAQPVTCTVEVPGFDKLHRVVIRWRDPVQLDLHVIEPGGRLGEVGHVSGGRPNSQLTYGIGQLDVVGASPAEGATSEISYIVPNRGAIPTGGVFTYRLDYVTRGTQPDAPYCESHALGAPSFEFITIENGIVNTRRMTTNRARCRERIPDERRLVMIRY